MTNNTKILTPLHYRLRDLTILAPEDEPLLNELQKQRRDYPSLTLLQEEGRPSSHTRIIISGWGIRYRELEDGSRQILNYLVPGDVLGIYGVLFENAHASASLLTDSNICEIDNEELLDIFRRSARLAAALYWLGGQDERLLDQQILRLGAMNAEKKVAHILLELHHRLLASGTPCHLADTLPLTQVIIAESLGLSNVHVNRVLGRFRHNGLIDNHQAEITILDHQKLAAISKFDPGYLRPDSIPAQIRTQL